jgi:hypothetical protein
VKYLLLLLIPITILINIGYNNKTEFNFDPNYIYLFNGVNLATLHGKIGHYDNPGTPAIVFSAMIMKITYNLRDPKNDFPIDVLQNPQYYVKMISLTFAAINCLLVFLLGFFILKTTHQLAYAFLFQSIPYFSKSVLEWSFQLSSPEPVLFGAVIIFVIFFVWKYYFNKSFGYLKIKRWRSRETESFDLDIFIIIIGFIIGFCLATKINSLPLILLPLLFIPKFKNKFIFLFIALISFIIFTLPIASYYIMFLKWIASLFLFSGLYGGGKMEIVNFNSYYENFFTFIKSEPVIFYTIVLSLVIILKQIIQKKYDIHLKILAGLFLVQVSDLLIVLKHFNLHYFIPIIPTLAVSLFIILQIFNVSKILKALIIVPLVALFLVLNMDFTKSTSTEYASLYQKEDINIYSYNCNSQMYWLKYGNEYSKNMNTTYLEKIYGKQYFYNIWLRQLTDWQDTITIDTLTKKNKNIYLYMYDDYLKDWPTPFKLKSISVGKYLIETKETDSLLIK